MANKISGQFLEKFGLDMMMVHYVTGDETHFRAILQPLRYKNKLYLSHKPTELSYDTLQKYLLIASPEAPLDKIDDYAYAQTMFITHSSVIALVLSPDEVEGDKEIPPVKEKESGNNKPKTKAKIGF